MQTAEPKENLLYQSERKTHTVSLASQCLDGCSLFFLGPPPAQAMHVLIIMGDSNWSCSCLQMKPAWLSSTEKRGDYAESGESADCRHRKDTEAKCLSELILLQIRTNLFIQLETSDTQVCLQSLKASAG